MRKEFLEKSVSNLLQRLSPPRAIANAADLQEQEMKIILKAVSSRAPTDAYESWFAKWEDNLLRSLSTRAWPTLKEVHDAADKMPRAAINPNDEKELSKKVEAAIEAKLRTGRAPISGNEHAVTMELIKRGVLADLREARWLGFDLNVEASRAACHQPCGRDEWEHHITVMARIRHQSFHECEAQEIREFKNRNQLPMHLRLVVVGTS